MIRIFLIISLFFCTLTVGIFAECKGNESDSSFVENLEKDAADFIKSITNIKSEKKKKSTKEVEKKETTENLTTTPAVDESKKDAIKIEENPKKKHKSDTSSPEDVGKGAEDFIQDLGNKAIEKLTGKQLTREERNKKFEKMFVSAFDYEKIGKFVLGRYRRDAKPTDMDEYIELFKKTIVSTYASRFGEYHGEKFKVIGNKIVDKDVSTIVVQSQILRPNGTKISIEWHLFQNNNKEYKIFDVVVEGVSMSLTQRSEFNAILQKEGSLHGLNGVLKNRQSSPKTSEKDSGKPSDKGTDDSDSAS